MSLDESRDRKIMGDILLLYAYCVQAFFKKPFGQRTVSAAIRAICARRYTSTSKHSKRMAVDGWTICAICTVHRMPCTSSFPSKKGCVITCQWVFIARPAAMHLHFVKCVKIDLKQAVLGSCISCQQPLDRPRCNDLPTVCISRVPLDAIIFQYLAMEGSSAITNLTSCEQQHTSTSLIWLYVWKFAPLSRQIVGHIVRELVCTLTSEFKCANVISRKYARNQKQPVQLPATCIYILYILCVCIHTFLTTVCLSWGFNMYLYMILYYITH